MSLKYWNLTLVFEFLELNRNAIVPTYKPDPKRKEILKTHSEAINSALANHRHGSQCIFGHALESRIFQQKFYVRRGATHS